MRSRIFVFPDLGVSAVDRRDDRRGPVCNDRDRCGCSEDLSGSCRPAEEDTVVALSMYFSMRRSLFQLKNRNNMDATLS